MVLTGIANHTGQSANAMKLSRFYMNPAQEKNT
jgi:hypothetical protein